MNTPIPPLAVVRNAPVRAPLRAAHVGLGLLLVLALASGLAKLAAPSIGLPLFDGGNYSAEFIYLAGGAELLAAAGLLLRPTRAFAALVLLLLFAAAGISHWRCQEWLALGGSIGVALIALYVANRSLTGPLRSA